MGRNREARPVEVEASGRDWEIISDEEILRRRPELRAEVQRGLDVLEGARLVRTMRERSGLSQAELAAKLGISQQRLSAIERGGTYDGPSYALLKRISRACGLVWPGPLTFESDLKQPADRLFATDFDPADVASA